MCLHQGYVLSKVYAGCAIPKERAVSQSPPLALRSPSSGFPRPVSPLSESLLVYLGHVYWWPKRVRASVSGLRELCVSSRVCCVKGLDRMRKSERAGSLAKSTACIEKPKQWVSEAGVPSFRVPTSVPRACVLVAQTSASESVQSRKVHRSHREVHAVAPDAGIPSFRVPTSRSRACILELTGVRAKVCEVCVLGLAYHVRLPVHVLFVGCSDVPCPILVGGLKHVLSRSWNYWLVLAQSNWRHHRSKSLRVKARHSCT